MLRRQGDRSCHSRLSFSNQSSSIRRIRRKVTYLNCALKKAFNSQFPDKRHLRKNRSEDERSWRVWTCSNSPPLHFPLNLDEIRDHFSSALFEMKDQCVIEHFDCLLFLFLDSVSVQHRGPISQRQNPTPSFALQTSGSYSHLLQENKTIMY